MQGSFLDYRVEILNSKFDNGIICTEKTVRVEFFGKNNRLVKTEDYAYVAFKRNELKHYQQEKILKHPALKLWIHLQCSFQKLVFDKMSLYATSPLRVFLSMLIVYVLFSLMYIIIPYFSDSEIHTTLLNPEPLSKIAIAFYYSAITFFTIGYGDYYPYGNIRWIACIEGFTGVLMMSYFIVAFVRKMLR